MKVLISLFTAFLFPLSVFAAAAEPVSKSSYVSNGLFIVLVSMIVLLLLVIIGMAEMLKASATHHSKRKKENGGNNAKLPALIFFLLASTSLFSQTVQETPVVQETPFNYWGLGAQMFYVLVSIIACEGVIIYVLLRMGMLLLRTKEPEPLPHDAPLFDFGFARSMQRVQTVEEEEAIMMDHEYDGIRELDNNLPRWWKYGFYLTIVVAVVYLFNYHVIGTGPSSAEEYANEMADAEAQIAEYKKNNAQMVDETSVTLLTDASSVGSGRAIYTLNCAACHGQKGEGLVGPNLTDKNWLHGGGIVNVFKSVKYGWTDKGMKSWQQDLKPLEIQQVASFILTLQGTNPPNAKAPEGEIYMEPAQTDSAATVTDSVGIAVDSAAVIKDTVNKK